MDNYLIMEAYRSELFPDTMIYIGLFINLENASELRKELKSLNISLLNPRLMVNLDHILFGANRGLYSLNNSTSKTTNLYLDIVYYLSGTSNIKQSLQKFGIQENSDIIIMLSINREHYDNAKNIIKGNEVSLDRLKEFYDEAGIVKEFKISQKELILPNGINFAVMGR